MLEDEDIDWLGSLGTTVVVKSQTREYQSHWVSVPSQRKGKDFSFDIDEERVLIEAKRDQLDHKIETEDEGAGHEARRKDVVFDER